VSTSDPIPGVPDPENHSLGDLVGQLTEDFSRLVRQEVELAKTEIKEEVSKAAKGAGMLGGAGVAGHLLLLFLSLTVMLALGNLMDLAWAALIVTVLWGLVAAVLAALGRKRLKTVDPRLDQTAESLKEDARWVKGQSS
jgi:uncharacterized membrane protein YqjE